MFEFLKQLNKKLSNNVLKIDESTSEKSVPYVMDKKLRKEVNEWLRDRFKSHMDISFGLILQKLGFNPEKTLYFSKVGEVYGLSLYYSYDKEIKGNDKIELSIVSTVFNEIQDDVCNVILSGKNYRKIYRCSYINNVLNIQKVNDMIVDVVNGRIYSRRFDPYGFWVSIKNCGYDEIILNCSGNRGFGIRNEEELKKYLLTISKDDSIKDIYSKISEISLGEEKNWSKIDLILKDNGKEVSKLYIEMKRLSGLYAPSFQYEVIDNGKRMYYQYYEPRSNYQTNTRNGLSEDDGLIELRNGDYGIVIKFPYFRGCYNELLIRDYLMNLIFPVDILDIYVKLNEVYENIYRVSIELTCKKKITDFIKISNNKLVNFKINRDEKEITLDKDGNFYYVSQNEKKKLSVDIIGDVVTKCEYSSLEGIENDNMGNSIYNGVSEAKEEKVRVRKMIDEMLNKDNA